MNTFATRFVFGCLSLTLCGLVMAQGAWPERPITLIVPFPAGGGVDIVARPFAERFGELLGKPVVVVNRDGASGTIGTAAVAAAKPDGYTLAFTASGPLTIQPHVIPTLAYKPDNLQPLCQVFASQYVFAVRSDSPFKSLDDFVKAAKAQPGKLTYGFGGVATSPHLAMAQFVNAAHVDVLPVPFRGDPAAIVALRSGEIDSAALNIGQSKAQGFRALATFADARQADYPDTPTLREKGYPVVSMAFGGLIGPKGIPDDVVTKIDAACKKSVLDDRFKSAARQSSQDAIYRNRFDYAQILSEDSAIKRDVVNSAGIKGP
jgi:tripartite-type tricarboxylate transporter receptor subunit TctC